jgi:hypothetical protein
MSTTEVVKSSKLNNGAVLGRTAPFVRYMGQFRIIRTYQSRGCNSATVEQESIYRAYRLQILDRNFIRV